MNLNSIYFSSIIFCCSVMISSCNNGKEVTEYALDSFFNKTKADSTDTITQINLCKIIGADWDSILIVKPYAKVSDEEVLRNLKNYSSLKPNIEDIRYTDFHIYLVFVKNNKAIGFSKVLPEPIYFGSLPSIDANSQSTAVVRKADCNKLRRRKKGSPYIYIQ